MKIIHKTFGGPSHKNTKAENIPKAQHLQSAKEMLHPLCGMDSFVASGKIPTDSKGDVISSCMFGSAHV